MSQSEKSAYFQALKAAGVEFSKHYREYTTDELKLNHDALVAAGAIAPVPPQVAPEPVHEAPVDSEAAAFFGFEAPEPVVETGLNAHGLAARENPAPPLRGPDPDEMAGQRLNTHTEDDVLRIDELGRQWLQEEVLKPAFPKPRGRRVLKYMDPGVKTETVTNGQFQETFEIPGDPANARPSEVKITLPSYQVGIYKDPRFPFKVVTYNGNTGFDFFDVQRFYGGSELVPAEIKRKYVENVLCYDIRTVIRAIESEYRQRQLTGQIS